jgi:V/A-type H+-transporting ATPase subunit I
MFLPARMKKLSAIVLDDYRDIFVKELHEMGVVELRHVEITDPDKRADFLSAVRGDAGLKEVIPLLLRINTLLNSLKTGKEGKRGVMPEKTKIEDGKKEDFILKAENLLEELEEPVNGLKDSLERVSGELEEISAYKQNLEKTVELDFDLKFLGDSTYLTTACGEMPTENVEALGKELENTLVIASGGEGVTPVIISGLNADKHHIFDAAKKLGFIEYSLPAAEGMPKQVVAEYSRKIEELQKKRQEFEEELSDLHSRYEQDVLVVKECLEIEKRRLDITTMFAKSLRTYFIQGYIPKKKTGEAEELLVKRTEGHAVMTFDDLDSEDEEKIPVLLENPGQVKPFEMLTEMFAPPKYNEFDPTLLLAPAFLIFFGIMLTDAVYGAVVVLIGYWIMKSFEKTSPSGRDLGFVLALAGLSAIFWGILFGSYFGNLFSPEGGLLGGYLSLPAVWLDPYSKGLYHGQSPVVVILIMSLLIGFLHLNMGNIIGLKESLKKGAHIKEVAKNLWLLLFQMGLILYFIGPKPFGAVVIFGGIGLLFYSEGILGFFGITGWLGDSLSYARLMALSLATGGIAIAVNIMVGMTSGIKFIGPLIAVVIFVVGHIFNIALNTLGGFIHSLRLHYVEFFGKFYEGGGNKFRPFKVERTYTKVER